MSRDDDYQAIVATPISALFLGVKADLRAQSVTQIDVLQGHYAPFALHEPFIKKLVSEIGTYFDDARQHFTVQVACEGSEFQHKVWGALNTIPAGSVVTYGELAARLHSSARAIGRACRTNPVALIVPCHRVVGRQGYGGYAGEVDGKLMAFKKWLLAHEQRAEK